MIISIELTCGVRQMQGPGGVRASEQYTLVTGLTDGMWMTAKLRMPCHNRAPLASKKSSGYFGKQALPGSI